MHLSSGFGVLIGMFSVHLEPLCIILTSAIEIILGVDGNQTIKLSTLHCFYFCRCKSWNESVVFIFQASVKKIHSLWVLLRQDFFVLMIVWLILVIAKLIHLILLIGILKILTIRWSRWCAIINKILNYRRISFLHIPILSLNIPCSNNLLRIRRREPPTFSLTLNIHC